MKMRIFTAIACCILLFASSVSFVRGEITSADKTGSNTPPCVEAKDSGEKVDNGVIVTFTGVIVTFTGVIVTFADDKAGDTNCGIILTD